MSHQHAANPGPPAQNFFGIRDVYVRPYDHIGHFYAGRTERFDVLVPFIVAGLETGDHCLCPILEEDVDDLIAHIHEAGADVAGVTATGLLVTTPGRSSAPEMAQLFAQASHQAHRAGRGLVRICADMTWTPEQVSSTEGLLGGRRCTTPCSPTPGTRRRSLPCAGTTTPPSTDREGTGGDVRTADASAVRHRRRSPEQPLPSRPRRGPGRTRIRVAARVRVDR